MPTSKCLGIKVDYGKPTSFESVAAEAAWMENAREEAIELKQKLESGQMDAESMPERIIIEPEPQEIPKAEADRFFRELIGIEDTLLTERAFVQLSFELSQCLGKSEANVGRSVELLEHLQELKLSKLMLIRNPECLDIIRQLRRYSGSLKIWNLDENEESEFKAYAKKIRHISTQVYDSFKNIFNYESDPADNFWTEFVEKVHIYKNNTKNTNMDLCVSMSELTYNNLMSTNNPSDD